MLMMLQSDQNITDAAVEATPDGYSTIWSTLGGVCNMVDQHETLLGGLPDHGQRMMEVNRLLGKVQTSVAEAIQDASLASSEATNAMSALVKKSTPGTGGPLNEMA